MKKDGKIGTLRPFLKQSVVSDRKKANTDPVFFPRGGGEGVS